MKRVIKSNSNGDNFTKFAIGLFVDTKLIGYLFKYNESRGTSVARISTDLDDAKVYNTKSSAKKALNYYDYADEIYVYDNTNMPVLKFGYYSEDWLNQYPEQNINRCKLEVVEL